jgi:hypothetical protein
MIRFDRRQRSALSETFRELDNLDAASFCLGQFDTGGQPFSPLLMLMGIGFWIAFVGVGLLLEGE